MQSRSRVLPHRLSVLVIALAALFLLAGCGGGGGKKSTDPLADVPEVTIDMQGVWNYETIARDCITNVVVTDLSDSGTDTLCSGDPMYEEEEDDIFSECDVSVGSNTFSIECDQTETYAGCTVTWSVDWQYNYSNTTITGTGTMSVSYGGSGCLDEGDECYNVSLTATRVGPAPAGGCPASAPRPVISRFVKLPSSLAKVANR